MLTYDYPVLGIFWTVVIISVWVIWLYLLFRIIVDLFRNDGVSGWSRAAWLVLLVILPYLGVLVYLVVHGSGMQQRSEEEARRQGEALREHIAQIAGTSSRADELAKFGQLRSEGVITEEEYERQKARLLA